MALLRWDEQDVKAFRDDMNRMWHRMRDDWFEGTRPRTHMHQLDNSYLVEFELPGVDPDSVDIEVDEGAVSVAGTFPAHPLEKDHREGETFAAVVELPTEINPESARAEWRHGLLQIQLTKASGRRRKITMDVTRGGA